VFLEHPGELVTRDLLREKLWANDTFVDFDRSLNTALTKLRSALCDSAENPRFIQTIPRQGYRFIAPVSSQIVQPIPREMTPAAAAPLQIQVPQKIEQRSRDLRKVSIPFAIAAFTTIVLAGAFYYLHSRSTRNFAISPISARRSVAVLAFKNLTADSSHAWLSTALSDWLSAELAAGEQLRTIPEENVARMKIELALPEVDSLSKDTLQRIRQNLGTDLVVSGSYASLGKSGAEVRVDVHLQDAASGETIGTISQVGTEDQLLDLISRTGERLRASAGVHPATPQESAAVAVALPSNPDAARSYSEGLAKLRLYDVLGARDLFQKTITSEPNFALGHSALSAAWSKLGYDSAAVEEGKKASELSATLPRAERLLVQARYLEVSKQWDQAIEVYRSLFEFFPDNIDYGLALAQAQISGGKGKDASHTVANLRALPPPLGSDARIDLVEASAADTQGDLKHALASADSAIDKARSVGASLLAADGLMIRANMLQGLGRLPEASSAVNESQQIFHAAGDKDKVARAQARAAQLVDLQGDFARAMKMYESSLAMFREIGDREGVAIELNNVGIELQNSGDLAEAKKKFSAAVEASSEVRDQWGLAVAQANLGEILFDLGDLPSAKQMYEGSLTICQAIGNKDMGAYVLSGLGRVLHAQGELQAAEDAERKAVTTFSEIGQIHTDANVALADVLLDLGKNEEAAAEAHKALQILDQSGVVNDQPLAEATLAKVLLAQHNRTEAKKASVAASTALGRRITMETKLIVEIQKARVLAASDRAEDRKEAEDLFREAIDESRRIGLLSEELDARLGSAELDLSLGHIASAKAKLETLQTDASGRGWLTIARKAATDLSSLESGGA
jgi:tetratricopeptide (TPR) repeat protein/DNA-binding winged helix-turn-helix (wHTH) protein